MRGHVHPNRKAGPHRKHIPGPLTLAAGGTKGQGEAWQQVHETSTVAGEGARGSMVAPVCSHPCSDAGWESRLSLQPIPCPARTLAG